MEVVGNANVVGENLVRDLGQRELGDGLATKRIHDSAGRLVYGPRFFLGVTLGLWWLGTYGASQPPYGMSSALIARHVVACR